MGKTAVRAIIIKRGKVLLAKRARNDSVGKWALVGGKPEANESSVDAVVREVQEELGLLFHPTYWIERKDNKSVPEETWTVHYFYGKADGELKPKENEISDVIYVGEADLTSLNIAFDHREVLTIFFQKILKI
ncbi:MAG: NUDIX domain-containing protein [Candidatus Gottesmanbacteria bacterium]|nr:NUDIX domain-containing protein [Candidatus Gottesmanbacteria bacterium]